jgi:multiple sugar transport system substrate-binding protein
MLDKKKLSTGILFAFCSIVFGVFIISQSSLASTQPQITFYFGKDPTGVDRKLISQFEAKTGIKVKAIELPPASDVQAETIKRNLMLQQPADVVRLDIQWIAECAAAGWLQPLEVEAEEKFLPGPIEGCTYKGKIYAIPFFTDFGLLYYREDLLDKYGFEPPETWAELVNQCEVILDGEANPELNGFVFQAKQYEGFTCCFLEFLWSNGGRVYDDFGRVVINNEEGVGALEFMEELIEKSIVPKEIIGMIEEDTRSVFQDERAIFMRNWPYAYALAQQPGSKIKGKVGIAPLPRGQNGKQGCSCLGGWNLAIPAYSEHKAEAKLFIEFMTGYDAQKQKALEGGFLPTRKALYLDGDITKAMPYFVTMGAIGEYSRPRPVVPYYSKITETIQLEGQKALLGEKSPKAALDTIAKEIKDLEEIYIER